MPHFFDSYSTRNVQQKSLNADTWKPFHYFNLYRIVLSGLFVALLLFNTAPRLLGEYDLVLFTAVSWVYLTFAVISSFFISKRWLPFELLLFIHVSVDIVVITLWMYASGGVISGIGILLVVAVAGGSILTAGRTAILFAAMATLAVLAQEVYATLYAYNQPKHYTQTGLLGAVCFATAILAHNLARRIRESEALATQRGLDIANLEQLNEHIIQRMQSGILAIDDDGIIKMANKSAIKQLGMKRITGVAALNDVCSGLYQQWRIWQKTGEHGAYFVRPEGAGSNVFVSFADLKKQGSGGTVVFLEDGAAISQRAQHLKLASLGRLTASIAHEIRNPLGAISHAGQLLQESPALENIEDQRLMDIIHKQSVRVNEIIETVMTLSRRKAPEPQTLHLSDWLHQFTKDFCANEKLAEDELAIKSHDKDLNVEVDPSHLTRVLENLSQNALRYAHKTPRIILISGYNEEEERIYLDICDSGDGFSEENESNIFEPFFTTESTGTGLGLYISRELCEVNQTTLRHLGHTENGHCFRISFAHPQRHSKLIT